MSRVTKKVVSDECGVLKEEAYGYDAAGNIVCSEACADDQYVYDVQNRLISYNGQTVRYDADGNMVSAPLECKTVRLSTMSPTD